MLAIKRDVAVLFLGSLLIVSLVYIPKAYSQEAPKEMFDEAFAFVKDVFGLDVASYDVRLGSYFQRDFLGVLQEESVSFVFESNESRLEIICNFVDNNLYWVSILGRQGPPRMTKVFSNEHEYVREFLGRYIAYHEAAKAYLEIFREILDSVEVGRNATKVSEQDCVKFRVHYEREYNDLLKCTMNTARFEWTYIFNGVEAPSKTVILDFENGTLKFFVDKWDLYQIGSCDIRVSKEEAIEIAKKAAEGYSWQVNYGDKVVNVTEFNVKGVSKTELHFGNYISKSEARGGSPLILYPIWDVIVYFDKVYPGDVYGLWIKIWADTGEVSKITPMMWMGDHPLPENGANDGEHDVPQVDNRMQTLLITCIALISVIIVLTVALVYSRYKRARNPCSQK